MGSRVWEAAAWVIVLGVIGVAAYQGNGFATTVPECIVYGCLLGLSVFCAFLAIGDDDVQKAKSS